MHGKAVRIHDWPLLGTAFGRPAAAAALVVPRGADPHDQDKNSGMRKVAMKAAPSMPP